MLAENNLKSWENLYDKYAPVMYAVICNLTDNKAVAAEILTEAFMQVKQKQILLKINISPCIYLLRHTYNYANQHLKQSGINLKAANPKEETKLIQLLRTQCSSLKDAAFILNITEDEAKKKLHEEVLECYNLKAQTEDAKHAII